MSSRNRLLATIILVVILSVAVSASTSYLITQSMYGRQSISTVTRTLGVAIPAGAWQLWQLDNLVTGTSVGQNSCGLNAQFNHSGNAAIIILVYSTKNLPSTVQYTSEMTLSLLASYDASGSSSPPNQPSISLYAGSAANANSQGNFNAIFSSAQDTCLIIALSWTFPGKATFTFNNYVVGTAWVGTTGLTVTQGADTNPNRLCLFFASIYGEGGSPTASNSGALTVLQTVGTYQSSPHNSISAQIAYIGTLGSNTVTMTANTSLANGILYPFIGVDPA